MGSFYLFAIKDLYMWPIPFNLTAVFAQANCNKICKQFMWNSNDGWPRNLWTIWPSMKYTPTDWINKKNHFYVKYHPSSFTDFQRNYSFSSFWHFTNSSLNVVLVLSHEETLEKKIGEWILKMWWSRFVRGTRFESGSRFATVPMLLLPHHLNMRCHCKVNEGHYSPPHTHIRSSRKTQMRPCLPGNEELCMDAMHLLITGYCRTIVIRWWNYQ